MADLGRLAKAAYVCGMACLPAAATAFAQDRPADRHAARSYDFSIPAKSRLAALADFTAATGIQIVRPGEGRIAGTSAALAGRYSADAALAALLEGSGLSYRFTGPRTVTIRGSAASDESAMAVDGDTVTLAEIEVQGADGTDPRSGISEIKITAEDLARRNPTDIRDVFRTETGVAVGSSLPMSQKVYVQGVEETNLAVSIDGSRQNNKVFHHNATTLIDPNLLRSARIDAGVAPADAGPGALAGALAYETRDVGDFLPEDGFGGMLKSTFDFNGNVSTNNVTGYGRRKGFEALGSFTFANGGEFEAGNGREVLGTETDFLSGLGKIAYVAPTGDRFEISHEQIRDEGLRPYRANAASIPPRAGDPAPPAVRPYTLERSNTVFTYSRDVAGGWWNPDFLLAYSRSKVAVAQYDLTATPPRLSHTGQGIADSLNGKLENRFDLPFGELTAGLDFYRDQAEYTDIAYRIAETADNFGAYSQARLAPFERARLSFGLRADHQNFSGVDGFASSDQGLSTNISGEYDLTGFLIAKAGYSRVWAGVPLAEGYVQNPAWDYGDGPRSVSSNNYTAGLVLHDGGLRIEAGVFSTAIEDARVPLYAATQALRAFDVETQGFALAAGYDWGAGFARARFSRTEAEIDGGPAETYLGSYLTAPIGDVVTLEFAHRFDRWNLTIGGDVEVVLDYDEFEGRVDSFGDPLRNLDGYEVVNAFVEYRPTLLPALTLRGEVKNLFDKAYAARGTYGQEYGTGVVAPLYEPGRTFTLSATTRF